MSRVLVPVRLPISPIWQVHRVAEENNILSDPQIEALRADSVRLQAVNVRIMEILRSQLATTYQLESYVVDIQFQSLRDGAIPITPGF